MYKWLNRVLAIFLLISITILPASAVSEDDETPYRLAAVVVDKEQNPPLPTVINEPTTQDLQVTVISETTTTASVSTSETVSYDELEARINDLESFQEESRERLGIIEREYVDINEVDRVSEQHCKCNN